MDDKSKYVKRGIKDFGKTAIGSAEILAGMVGTAVFPLVGIPLTIHGAQNLLKGVRGEYIKGSMINVVSNKFYSKMFYKKENRIIQEFPSISHFIAATLTKNKMNFLLMQELNFLLGSDTLDKNGERITYTTHSQSLTKLMLSRIQKAGMIQNLKFDETKPKALVIEKLMLGNAKNGLFKKDKMFEMSFSKTDKKITEEEIMKFLKIDTIDNEKYIIKRDKDNNILSINYRTSTIIKDKLKNVKDNILQAKDAPKMLYPVNEKEKNEGNQQEAVKNIDSFSKNLGELVNKSGEIKEADSGRTSKEIEMKDR